LKSFISVSHGRLEPPLFRQNLPIFYICKNNKASKPARRGLLTIRSC